MLNIDVPLGGDRREILAVNIALIARQADDAARLRAYYAMHAMSSRQEGKQALAAHYQRGAAAQHTVYEMARETWSLWAAMLAEMGEGGAR